MNGKILIVDDVATNRIVLKVKLGAAGYRVSLATDGADCLNQAAQYRPDLILLDLHLPDMTGIEVVTRLRRDALTRRIPVVMFSSASDPLARMAALRAGADDFLAKPIADQTLMARLRNLMRQRDSVLSFEERVDGLDLFGFAEPAAAFESPGLVALVTENAETALHLRHCLQAHSPDRFVLMNRGELFSDHTPPGGVPDVYLIEADHSGPGGGLRLMSDLLSRPLSRHSAFCVLNTSSEAANAAMAFDLGAQDQVDLSHSPSEVAVRLHGLVRRKREADRLRSSVQDGLRLAMFDPLTGLHNRRYGLAQLTAIAERAQVDQTDFAVMVLDLDRFKAVNDTWGHASGDAVLVEVAARLAANLRASDLLARIGGEEFLVALPATSQAEAQAVAERLCRAVDEVPVPLPDGLSLAITISIGMVIAGDRLARSGEEPVAQLIDAADRALMKSKEAGRNQVTISLQAA
jgi:two-component system cell cycle response regulator